MKPKRVKVCPDCEAVIESMEDLEVRYRCGECEKVYEDREEAKDCCKEV